MIKEEQEKKLIGIIKELSQLQSSEIDLMVAIFNRNINNIISEYMIKISDDFSLKCKFYKRNEVDVEKIKTEIISSYEREFEKISDRFNEQFINIIYELQEAQLNQMVIITNYKHAIEEKENFKSSKEYKNYINKIEEFTLSRDNAETKADFDKFDKALVNLKNPITYYEEKIDLIVQKYGAFCALEEDCYSKLEECTNNAKIAIDSVMKYDKEWIDVKRKANIFSFFNKLLNRFVGAKKFEKEFVSKKVENIKLITENTDKLIEDTRKDTVIYVEAIAAQKDQIKKASNTVA